MNFTTADAAVRDKAAAGVGDYGRYHMNYSLPAAHTAQGFDDQAMERYKAAYDIEAPNAGYGLKAIAALAGPALATIPGAGPILATAANGAGAFIPGGQQGGQGGQQSSPYSAPGQNSYPGTPPFNPNAPAYSTPGQQQNPYNSAYSSGDWFKPLTNWRQNRNPNQLTIKQNSSGYLTAGGK
jgi:hypothetical protein